MENKLVEAVRESVEALRSSLLEELVELRTKVAQMDEKVECVMMAAATAASQQTRLHQDSAADDNDVGL